MPNFSQGIHLDESQTCQTLLEHPHERRQPQPISEFGDLFFFVRLYKTTSQFKTFSLSLIILRIFLRLEKKKRKEDGKSGFQNCL